MYDADKNNMWPQHQQQFMGSVPPHPHPHAHQCHQSHQSPSLSLSPSSSSSPSPSPSSTTTSSSSLLHLETRSNHHHHGVVDLPVPSNPRASRNMAEKQRRDNLNSNISAMAALVPAVAGSSRRMDKISILRLAAAFLRSQYTLGPGTESFLPRHYDLDLEQYVIENLVANAGFFIVVTTSGTIVYVSRYIEHQLGHAQHELLGQSWYKFVCPEDYDELRRNLTPDELQSASVSNANALVKTTEDNSSSSDDPASPRNERNFTAQRRNFNIRMSQKALNKREHGQYECLQISGQLRLANACTIQGTNLNRLRNRDANSTNNDVVLVGVATMIKKRTITDLSLLEATKDEYVTRHLVDGRIIFCDHRISVVAGYMTEEVSGLSAFKFMHKEDVRWTMIALRQMYDRGEGFGSSCYRLLSKTGQFIYLRTHGYLEFDKNTQTVESFVCVNSLMSESEGAKLVKEMKERFAAVISGPAKAMIAPSGLLSSGSPDVQPVVDPKATVEDPVQLEDAIHHLISDLPSPSVPDSQQSMPLPDNQYYKAAIFSHGLPPASIQADKIGLKSMDCKSPPDKSSLNKERRNSVLGTRGMSPIGRRFKDNNNLAGPSIDQVKKEVELRNLMEKTVAEPSNQRMSIPDNTEDTSNAGSDEEIRMGNSQSPSPSCKDSNNLQEPQSPRRRIPHNRLVREMDRRYVNDGGAALDSTDPESRVSSSVYEQSSIVGEEKNVRKRSRSSEQLPPGSTEPKRKANEIIVNQDFRISIEQLNENVDAVYNGIIAGKTPEISGDRCAGDIRESFADIQNGIPTDVPILESMEAYQHFEPVAGASHLLDSSLCGQQIEDVVDEDEDLHESMLSPSLDADPDLMKTFEDLQAVMCNRKTIDEANINEFTASDQAVNEGIRRTQFQLEKSIAMRESQLSVLKRDLNNPALLAQRENFDQLEAEHNKQKQMLKTLQQDHLTLQANMQQNIGV